MYCCLYYVRTIWLWELDVTYEQSFWLCENRFRRNEKWVQRSALNKEDKNWKMYIYIYILLQSHWLVMDNLSVANVPSVHFLPNKLAQAGLFLIYSWFTLCEHLTQYPDHGCFMVFPISFRYPALGYACILAQHFWFALWLSQTLAEWWVGGCGINWWSDVQDRRILSSFIVVSGSQSCAPSSDQWALESSMTTRMNSICRFCMIVKWPSHMLLTQRSYMFIPCPVHLVLRPTAKLAYDMGRGSQSRVWYSTNKGEIQTLNIAINQTKQGFRKMPLWGIGMQACKNSVIK